MKLPYLRFLAGLVLALSPALTIATPSSHAKGQVKVLHGEGPIPQPLIGTRFFGPGDGPMPIKPCFGGPHPLENGTSRSPSHCGHPGR